MDLADVISELAAKLQGLVSIRVGYVEEIDGVKARVRFGNETVWLRYLASADPREGEMAQVADVGGTEWVIGRIALKPGGLRMTGELTAVAGDTWDAPWLLCDGSTYQTTDYEALAAHLDASGATFQVPDYRGRMVIGGSAARPVGSSGGVDEVVLTIPQMPEHAHSQDPTNLAGSHSHTIDAHGYSSGGSNIDHHHTREFGDRLAFRQNSSISGGAQTSNAANSASSHAHTNPNTNPAGGSTPHENMPPYRAANWLIHP